MHVMLSSHISYSTSQFTYLEGQITALSSQIDDMMRNLRQEPALDSESDTF